MRLVIASVPQRSLPMVPGLTEGGRANTAPGAPILVFKMWNGVAPASLLE